MSQNAAKDKKKRYINQIKPAMMQIMVNKQYDCVHV